MKYIIRKVPERNTKYLERLLPEAEIVNDVNHNGCVWSFLKAIEVANDDAIYIQDDMLLCKDFKKKAEEYVKKYPSSVIIFSSHIIKNAKKYAETIYREEKFYTGKEGGTWLLCTYIPKKIGMEFFDFIVSEECKKLGSWKKYEKMQADDLLFCKFLDLRSYKAFVVVPQLAGHEENKSVVLASRPKRISPLFDYKNCEQKGDSEK